MAEGQTDPLLGEGDEERRQRLLFEMGDPHELGRQLKRIHRSFAWLEYLLIVVPNLILSPVITLFLIWIYPKTNINSLATEGIGYRLSIWIYLGLTWVGYRLFKKHGSNVVFLYYLTLVCIKIIGLFLRGKFSGSSAGIDTTSTGVLEGFFWTAVFIGLLFWLIGLLWKIKDPLWITFVTVLFISAAGNLFTGITMLSGGFPNGYQMPDWRITWFGISQISEVLWPAVFLFTNKRAFRWVALLISTMPIAAMNIYASASYPGLVLIHGLPAALVLVLWILETIQNRQVHINKTLSS